MNIGTEGLLLVSGGFSGYRAITVWKYFQVARPSSALERTTNPRSVRCFFGLFGSFRSGLGGSYLAVSLPSLGITTAPFNVSSCTVIAGADVPE